MESEEHSEPDDAEPDEESDVSGQPAGAGGGPDDGPAEPVRSEGDPGDGYDADGEGDPPGVHTALPPRVEAWRKRSAAGAILTGFALGLQEALETRREEPSITIQTSGDPPKDLPVDADFEYGRPKQSVVQIRPWLTGDGRQVDPEPEDEEETGE